MNEHVIANIFLFYSIANFALRNPMLNAQQTSTRTIPADAKTKYVMAMAKLLLLVTLSGVPSGGIPPVSQQLINLCQEDIKHTWKSR